MPTRRTVWPLPRSMVSPSTTSITRNVLGFGFGFDLALGSALGVGLAVGVAGAAPSSVVERTSDALPVEVEEAGSSSGEFASLGSPRPAAALPIPRTIRVPTTIPVTPSGRKYHGLRGAGVWCMGRQTWSGP